MLVWPAARRRASTRLRSAAITSGADPVRIWLASSPSVTARTSCSRFSIDQCPRTKRSRSGAPAIVGRRVIASRVSRVAVPFYVTTRSTWQTYATPGQSR